MTCSTRVRGFAPWSPQRKSRELVDQVMEVLTEYRDYQPLTIRQVFYRLVGRHNYDKTENAYNRLCETMNRARRAGLIDFKAIRDDGVLTFAPDYWNGVDEVMRAIGGMADSYTLDRQAGQPVRLFVMCEAAGMAKMLADAIDDLGVSVLSSGGFDSLTSKHDFAKDLTNFERVEVLHVGDHDPSGVHIFNALAEDMQAMCAGLGMVSVPAFTRLAVTPDQIEAMGLPTAPAKTTDKRSFEGETVQAEAIPPDVLIAIVRQAVIERQDQAIRADLMYREESDRHELRSLIDRGLAQ